MSTTVQTSALPFWKLPPFVSRIEISEILLCLILTLHIATVLPLVAFRMTNDIGRDIGIFNERSVLLNEVLN